MPKSLIEKFAPSQKELAAILKARQQRQYQRKSRGDKFSANDKAENLCILLALEAGEVSEGTVAKLLHEGCRVTLREHKLRAIALGCALAATLK